ncbi:hypothetical protein EfmAA290_28090 [Enterococcus faecium]|nr:hypothetical protein EfmAA290_28090 [Enterococcus faecium]
MTVTLPDGSQHHGTADKNGNFTVKVPKLEAGTKVIVTATDESGNTSEPTNVVVSSNKKTVEKTVVKVVRLTIKVATAIKTKIEAKASPQKFFLRRERVTVISLLLAVV